MEDDIIKVRYGIESCLPGTRDSNTLYFTTDTKRIFKGDDDYTGSIKNVTIINREKDENGIDLYDSYTIKIEYKDGTSSTAYILNTSLLQKVISVFKGTVNLVQTPGLVKLFDSANNNLDATQGTAATPKAVYKALEDAKQYADDKVNDAIAALDVSVLKGAIGEAKSSVKYWDTIISDDSSINNTAFQDLTGYKAGWTFRILYKMTLNLPNWGSTVEVEPGDMIMAIRDYVNKPGSDGSDDWLVIQANINNAVTYQSDLEKEQLIIGAGRSSLKSLVANPEDKDKVLTVDVDDNDKVVLKWKQFPEHEDANTTYEFEGYDGGFSVTPSTGNPINVSIGKPDEANTADVAKQFRLKTKDSYVDKDFGETAGMSLVREFTETDGTVQVPEEPLSAKLAYNKLKGIEDGIANLEDGVRTLTEALTWKSFESES